MKNMNGEVFNLKSRLNEKTELFQHESCKCDWTEWRLTEGVYSSKEKWNHDERHCGCTELDAWSSCKDDCMWNPSTCDAIITSHVKLMIIQIFKKIEIEEK